MVRVRFEYDDGSKSDRMVQNFREEPVVVHFRILHLGWMRVGQVEWEELLYSPKVSSMNSLQSH